ncbi:hypothetical protein CAPTEDRAFT_228101 [Capitella teleta]|uniref:Transmembrane protein n=1 Tax=Capitella teleta TaxID=283909 RepID=R7TPC1_CAPTE|nr:hypothetical protein CAPTEDRAFT_228101 [Capitella teleta]|eukprot:ELT95738.1 hypothetical protein CAPTEDRAFT_228101 [Capitella teleta]
MPDNSKSGYREASLVLCMLTSVVHFVGLLTYFWAVPATREYDPNLEGMGLWKYCRWEKDDLIERHVCAEHAHIPGKNCVVVECFVQHPVAAQTGAVAVVCSLGKMGQVMMEKRRLAKQCFIRHDKCTQLEMNQWLDVRGSVRFEYMEWSTGSLLVALITQWVQLHSNGLHHAHFISFIAVLVAIQSHQARWLRDTQICFTVGIVFVLLSLINIIMSDCVKKLRYDSIGMMSFVILNILAAIMTSAAVIKFGMNIQDHPIEEFNGTIVYMRISWSYGLSCTAVVFQMVSMVMAILDLHLRPRSMDTKILRFSLSFPGSSSDQTPIQDAFDNLNFDSGSAESQQ